MATTTIETVRRLHIPTLVNILHPAFAYHYEDGLAHSLFEDHERPGPLHDLYLVDIFTLMRQFQRFDSRYEQELYRHIGFTLGEIHGGVLLSNGATQPDVTTLVTLHNPDIKRGYEAGREFFFTEADSEKEWHRTDRYLVGQLHEMADEYGQYQDAERTIRFIIGQLLGELSGHLFPWTHQEQSAIEEDSIKCLGYICHINPHSIAARQFCMQAIS